MNIGDQVLYVPALCHARERDSQGDFPWVFGWQARRPKRDPRTGREDAGIDELSANETALKLDHLQRSPNAEEKKKLHFIRPRVCWRATVRAVRGQGDNEVADLDVTCPTATLHYDGVPVVDEGGTLVPHSCFVPKAPIVTAAIRPSPVVMPVPAGPVEPIEPV